MKLLLRNLVSFAAATLLSVAATAQQPADTRTPDAPPQMNLPQRAPLNPKLPTIFVVGDSTASNGADLGWGDHFANYFDLTKVNVANRSRAGRSSRSYMVEGLWDTAPRRNQARRLRAAAVGTQPRRRPWRSQAARRSARLQRRDQRRAPNHRSARRQDRDHPHLRLVQPQICCGYAGQRRHSRCSSP